MAQPIEQLTVSCFDVHVSFDPLLYPEQLAPAARFLADASDYRKQQSAPQPLELPGFRVFPLRSELDDNHFWRQFASARPSFAGGVHDFLLPFRCRPKSFDAWAKAPAAASPVRARATIWLWPFAWSSVIEISLRTPLALDELRSVAEAIRSPEPPSFTLAGSARALSDLFKWLSAALRHDITLSGDRSFPPAAITRHVILAALPSRNAPAQNYRAAYGANRWSDADRARMHSALLGRTVPLTELIERESQSAFLLSEFSGGSGFGLTDFGRGTFLMLPPAPHFTRRRDRLRCLAANIRHCSLVGLVLAETVRSARRLGDDNQTIGALAKAAAATLDKLPSTYPNPFCRTFFDEHSGVQKARA